MITICQSNFDCIKKCKNSCFIHCIIVTFLAKRGSFVLLLIDKLSTVSHENGVYIRVLSTVDSAVDYSLLSRGLQVYTVKLSKFNFFSFCLEVLVINYAIWYFSWYTLWRRISASLYHTFICTHKILHCGNAGDQASSVELRDGLR